MKPTGATKEASVTTEWTLSKPLTNQIINNDLRQGMKGTMPVYGIDVPKNKDVTHFAGVLVFGDEQRAKDIVTAINERERLREALRMARTVIFAENRYKTWDKELAQIDAVLNDAAPSTSAGGG